jgi:hypothetical protein
MANDIKHSTPKYRLDRLTVALWNKGIDPVWDEETKMWNLIDKRTPIDEVMIERSCSECLISNKNWDKDDLEERASNYKQIKPSEVLRLIDSGINPNRFIRIRLPVLKNGKICGDGPCSSSIDGIGISRLVTDLRTSASKDNVMYILINDEEEK